MYKTIVARRTRSTFAALNGGDSGPLLAGLAAPAYHVMHGSHPLGGERTTRAAIEQWYARLFRLLPDLHFDVRSVLVAGPPWRTTVTVEWRDRALGGRYENQGVNVVRLAWGKVKSIEIHCDTQDLARSCADIARQGTEEAAAAPITDGPEGAR